MNLSKVCARLRVEFVKKKGFEMKSLITTTLLALAATLCFGQLASARVGYADMKFVNGLPAKETAITHQP